MGRKTPEIDVQKLCGVRPTALGSLSEASRVFDPAAREAALAGLVAVDGSLLPALPKMAWASWQDSTHWAAKMHVAFGVFEGVPRQATVTVGNASERDQLRQMVEPGGFYVADRGYADYSMFREFDEAGCRFVIRIQHNSLLERPLRIVITEHEESGEQWVLATNALDLPAELIAIADLYLWQVELFFRWLKCVLGCRHLVSQKSAGRHASGVLRNHRRTPDRPVGRPQTEHTRVGNALALPQRLGHDRRTPRSPQKTKSRQRTAKKMNKQSSCRTLLARRADEGRSPIRTSTHPPTPALWASSSRLKGRRTAACLKHTSRPSTDAPVCRVSRCNHFILTE
jgi:hypothetical protein